MVTLHVDAPASRSKQQAQLWADVADAGRKEEGRREARGAWVGGGGGGGGRGKKTLACVWGHSAGHLHAGCSCERKVCKSAVFYCLHAPTTVFFDTTMSAGPGGGVKVYALDG